MQMLLHKLRAANNANMKLVLENKQLMESSKVGSGSVRSRMPPSQDHATNTTPTLACDG